MPKLSELYDRFVTDDPENFCRGFPARLRDEKSVTFAFYEEIEAWLSYIPEPEWPYFTDKIKQTVFLCDRSRRRFWGQLHDVLTKPWASCSFAGTLDARKYISFVRPKGACTPDLAGRRGPMTHYLEVKTINNSQDERDSWYHEHELNDTTLLPAALKKKIQSSYLYAVSQLSAPEDANTARKIALLVLNPDYNFDPTDKPIAEQIGAYLDHIEQPSFEMICHIM